MLKGFKDFVLRGNVIDLAVAVVVGTAFTAVVTSIVTNLINPLISVFFSSHSLDTAWIVTLNGSQIKFGAVLGSIITFVIIAAVVYFAFVYPLSAFNNRMNRSKSAAEEAPAESEQELLTQIRDLLRAQKSDDETGESRKS